MDRKGPGFKWLDRYEIADYDGFTDQIDIRLVDRFRPGFGKKWSMQ